MEILTVRETAKVLKVSTDKAYSLTKTPDFPAFYIGRSIRVIGDKLPEWVASQSGGGENDQPPR